MVEASLWVENTQNILQNNLLSHYADSITDPLDSQPELLKSWDQIRPAFLKALEVESLSVAIFLMYLTDKCACHVGWIPENTVRPVIEYFNGLIDRKEYTFWNYAACVIYNLSLLESAREEVRDCGAVEKLLFMRENSTVETVQNDITSALACLLGHIENNKHLVVDDAMISSMIKIMTLDRIKSEERISISQLWESLIVFAVLVKADQNKKVIAKYHKEIFACVTGKNNSEDYLADERTRNLIWQVIEQLSFLAPIQEAIRSDDDLMVNIRKFSNVDRTCAGILWNIRKTDEVIHSVTDEGKNEEKVEHIMNEEKDEHIMISYTWKYQDCAKKIAKYLKNRNYKVWMDIEQMSGSTLEAMADAIERSSIVLILYSEAYKNSANCRREGEYVASLNKPFIPVLTVDGYRPDGWLGILLGARLWFNLSSDENFQKNVNNLDNEILKKLSSKTKGNMKKILSTSGPKVVNVNQNESLSFPSKFAKPPEVQRWLKQVGVADSISETSATLKLDGAWLCYYQRVAKTSNVEDFCRISKEFFPEMSMVDLFKLGGWMID